jgi:threonine dehydrogenase-like Zn-dependent dehydrogenase
LLGTAASEEERENNPEFIRLERLWLVGSRVREIFYVCRPAGPVSMPGVYGGLVDKIPFGMFMNKGLTLRTGQTHVNRWTDDLLHRIEEGQIDPSFVITHHVALDDGPRMYKTFRDKEDGCVKVVLKP